MVIDIGVKVSDGEIVGSFVHLASQLGFTAFATTLEMDQSLQKSIDNFVIYGRTNLKGRGIKALRNQVNRARRNSMIIAIEFGSIDTMNWAAEEPQVDLITLSSSGESRLRDSTARLAAASLTSLELQIQPILCSTGLNRSKILKIYREAVLTAIDAGMGIVLSSGASHPMGLRSPEAIVHIGMLLGLDRTLAKRAIYELPSEIIAKNMKKQQSEFVNQGVEILRGRDAP